MVVKDVLKCATQYLQLAGLSAKLSIANPVFTSEEQAEINLLITCLNLSNDLIATDYFRMRNKYVVENVPGIIPFSNITGNVIIDIYDVKDFDSGSSVDFEITSTGINTVKSKVVVYYDYLPTKVDSLNDSIICYPLKITERILAFGVASEYLFLKGDIDDSYLWDVRFKNSILNVASPRKIPQLPKRRWL